MTKIDVDYIFEWVMFFSCHFEISNRNLLLLNDVLVAKNK